MSRQSRSDIDWPTVSHFLTRRDCTASPNNRSRELQGFFNVHNDLDALLLGQVKTLIVSEKKEIGRAVQVDSYEPLPLV